MRFCFNRYGVFALFLSVFFISCASNSIDSSFSSVYVTNTSKYNLLSTTYMEEQIDGIQQMTAKFGTQSFDFEVYVLSNHSELLMTIFNDFGSTMASLFYSDSGLEFDSNVFPKNLKAEYIVADFQFCLYNAEVLKSALKKSGIDFEFQVFESDGNIIEMRKLSKNKKEISKITKTYSLSANSNSKKLDSIQYENFLRSYSYVLTSVEEEK